MGVGLVVLAIVCYTLAVNIVAPLQQRYGSLPVLSRALAVATVLVLPRGLTTLADIGPGLDANRRHARSGHRRHRSCLHRHGTLWDGPGRPGHR